MRLVPYWRYTNNLNRGAHGTWDAECVSTRSTTGPWWHKNRMIASGVARVQRDRIMRPVMAHLAGVALQDAWDQGR
jgi:hypothetical protein